MPLQMGGVETERPKTLVFDTECPDQAREVSEELTRLMNAGFIIDEDHDKLGEFRVLPPPRPKKMSVMRALTSKGDDRLTWDRSEPSQVKDALKRFKDFLSKGYKAFAVLANGKKGHRLDDFDPLAEEILMVPATMPG